MWFRIKTDHRETDQIGEKAKGFLDQAALPDVGRGYQLIPVRLKEHLWLRHRGTKNPELHSCRCALPEPLRGETGEDRLPSSLNQAYTRLSEIFETYRSTHTGNVFEKGYFRIPTREEWKKLNDFRLRSPEKCVWQEMRLARREAVAAAVVDPQRVEAFANGSPTGSSFQ